MGLLVFCIFLQAAGEPPSVYFETTGLGSEKLFDQNQKSIMDTLTKAHSAHTLQLVSKTLFEFKIN